MCEHEHGFKCARVCASVHVCEQVSKFVIVTLQIAVVGVTWHGALQVVGAGMLHERMNE